MAEHFLPSKYGHILDDAQITLLVEPTPGTQAIYEYLSDCYANINKVYPPNTTLILDIKCGTITVLGELAKVVVERNEDGGIFIGNSVLDGVYTKEVVVKSSNSHIWLNNNINSLEI